MLFWTGPWLLKQDGRGGRYPAKSRLATTLFGMPTTKAEIVIVHTSYRCEHKGLATRRWKLPKVELATADGVGFAVRSDSTSPLSRLRAII